MKIIILCISLACLVLSCDQQSQGSRLSPPATLTALSHRLEAAPHPPLSKEALGAWLATCQLEGFSIKENNTSEFMINGQPVTEGKLVGVNKDGYVAMVITDYAADSSAFLNLYRRYLWESPAEPSPGLDWVKEYGGFAWIWKEDGSDIQYLEAGILDRFHLRVRSNLPDSDSLLQEVAASHRWQSIHR